MKNTNINRIGYWITANIWLIIWFLDSWLQPIIWVDTHSEVLAMVMIVFIPYVIMIHLAVNS